MTMILSLHGRPGAGKDTIADYLVETRGFIKFGYADALYRGFYVPGAPRRVELTFKSMF